ncbi:MAG: GDP-mannose 4,6-dehydratase [Candidatus Omnitrophota bacterium]
MRILITGITGFVGSHLAEYIIQLDEKHDVYGLCRWRSSRENLANIYKKIMLFNADICDLGSLIHELKTIKPDIIFHLAAQSYVVASFNVPFQTLWTNVIGTANLLEALRILKLNPRIHICSSSEVYGQVREEDVPIKEDCPLRPASPYGVSKVGEDMVALQYWLSYRMKTIRTRMFTHTGPRRGDVFALSYFANQIAAAELGLKEPCISVGNLKSVRTICDVRDAVKAYWLLIQHGVPGECYNIGGSHTMTIQKALDILLSFARVKCNVVVDEKLLRPSDVTLQIPCIEKFKEITGWEPEILPQQTLEDLLNYWREQLKLFPWKAAVVVR